MDLFDYAKAKELADAGIQSVGTHNASFVDIMRAEARRIARAVGSVTSDDLRRYAKAHDLKPNHPNAWGAIFRGAEWKMVGRMKSKLMSNHAREIKVWGLS